MKVKKIVAPTMPEVMNKVRKELGTDAVILNSKVVYLGGFLGMFKKKNIEVIAALDPQPESQFNNRTTKKKDTAVLEESKNLGHHEETNKTILEEIRMLKSWMETNRGSRLPSYPIPFQRFYEHLLNQQIAEMTAKQIVESMLLKEIEGGNQINSSQLKKMFSDEVSTRMGDLEFGASLTDKKFVHLVGPTGVGKTTTIAKIAADAVLKENKKVALITTDTYRIAAIDQLKTYAKILNLPMEVAYSMEDYKQARLKFEEYDLVLIDTAGRNYRDERYIDELTEIISLEGNTAVYLVLSLTAKYQDLEEILARFQKLPIHQLIFTKKDETSTYGSILNLCLQGRLGVAYLTNGQEVPDDIEAVDLADISRLIAGEFRDE
ncbi:flagellar biosynthesis protein FlhF [Sediminibacillus massiliensis]|uniref:flagellar biosynthesis protein FlhF n=1 Tax=Sediminibacillus massiliensis TaxID=1926277 RepID=UPI0009888233|nr:flagellar biosynthesis protein FlhF [Sediminibacillus massiliensis]